jgi:hypothetical protein
MAFVLLSSRAGGLGSAQPLRPSGVTIVRAAQQAHIVGVVEASDGQRANMVNLQCVRVIATL